MHSGTTGGDAPLNFGQAERVAYVKYIMPIWGRFMRACFSELFFTSSVQSTYSVLTLVAPEECRSRALPSEDALESLQSMATDNEDMSIDLLGMPEATPSAPPNLMSVEDIPSTPVSRLPTPITTAHDGQTTQTDIASITRAIWSMSRRIEESVARSLGGSPVLSIVPTPTSSITSSPLANTTKRTRSLSTPDPSPKRLCAGSFAPPSCTPPQDAPLWVVNSWRMFTSEPLEGKWQELVAAWLLYEASRNFDGKKLSPKGRPKIVADWIKWARKPTWRPSSYPEPEGFGHMHTAWWTSLQPSWRVKSDGTLTRHGEGERTWDTLHVGGVNGLLSALASLFFWGIAIHHAGANTDSWDNIVEDTLFVIQELTVSFRE